MKIIRNMSAYLLLFFLLNAFFAHADTEKIQYSYDDDRQVTNIKYDEHEDGTDVEDIDYKYDGTGNRLVKTITRDASANNAPSVPVYTYPDTNGALDVPLENFSLTWETSTDSDPGDLVYYDVYFGKTEDPPLVKSGTQDLSWQAELEPFTVYYWKITARDNHNAAAEGDIWEFTTEEIPQEPLVPDFMVSPLTTTENALVQFTDLSTSYKNSISKWEWDFDYKNDTFTVDSTEQNPSNTYNAEGSYIVGLRVSDIYGRVDVKTDAESPVVILPDGDNDGIPNDGNDNCPDIANPDQADTDGDSMGDVCDLDIDGDGIDNYTNENEYDNCLYVKNTNQADFDSDDYGDLCDPDMDGDGIVNEEDLCPLVYDENNTDADDDGFGDACTYVHCVENSSQLQDALDDINTTPEDDVIRLVQGTYDVSGTFSFSSLSTYRNLAILGGYTTQVAECDTRALDPSNTVINGNGENVFSINDGIASLYPHWIIIEGITIQNGTQALYVSSQFSDVIIRNTIIKDNGSASSTSGIYTSTKASKVKIVNNIIENNTAAGSLTGIRAVNTGVGEIVIANNIVAGNIANTNGGGISVYAQKEGTFRIINNTITGNRALNVYNGKGAGIYIFLGDDLAEVDIYNNIFWDNYAPAGGDIYISNETGAVNAYNNDLNSDKVNREFTSEGNNFNIDPQFEDAVNGDYHLSDTSQCIDAGTSSVPLMLDTDFEGDTRLLGLAVDIGADEYDPGTGAYILSGQVVFEGDGLQGVQVDLTGVLYGTRFTDEDGRYSLPALINGEYTVTPVHEFYDFEPAYRAVSIDGGNAGAVSFTALAKDKDADGIFDYEDNCPDDFNPDQSDTDEDYYGDVCDLPGSISGKVIDEDSGLGIEGVKVRIYGNTDFDYTDAFGNYSITGLYNGYYTLDTNNTKGYTDEYYDDTTMTYRTFVAVNPEQDTPGIDFALTPAAGHPSADAGGPYDAVEGTEITLDASGSYDDGGTIDSYQWDVDNDGVYDYDNDASSPTQSHTYAQAGTYTIRLKVTDNSGYTDADIVAANISLQQFELTTSVSPAGNGSINPDCSAGCLYDRDTEVLLNAIEDSGYPFDSWTGCDSPSGNNCTMTMDTDKPLTAVFDTCMYPARIQGEGYYSILQDAYDAASNDNTIQSMDYIFLEDLVLDRDVTVTMEGGYDCDYSNITGNTIVQGDMIINAGETTIEGLVVDDGTGGGAAGGSGSEPLIITDGFNLSSPSYPTSTPEIIE